jgi:hypothetical protein
MCNDTTGKNEQSLNSSVQCDIFSFGNAESIKEIYPKRDGDIESISKTKSWSLPFWNAELHGLPTLALRRSASESQAESGLLEPERPSADNWSNVEWLYCRDNKYRPILRGLKPVLRTAKSSSKPLVDGLPAGMVHSGDTSQPINANETQEARVMRLMGYGNAIVPAVTAEFIKAFMSIET